MIQNVFVMSVKKNIKTIWGKKVLVCLEASMGRLKTHQNYFWLNVLLVFLTNQENYIDINSRFLTDPV